MGTWYVLNVPWAWKSFWAQPMVLLGVVSLVEARAVHLEVVLVSVPDRCMVCVECTSGMEIILGTPDHNRS